MPPKSTQVDLEAEFRSFTRTDRLIGNMIANFEKLGTAHQTLAVTRGRIKLLDSYWTSCQESCLKIEQWATEEEKEDLPFFQQQLAVVSEEKYLAAYDFLQEKLGSFESPLPSPTGTATSPIPPLVSTCDIKLKSIDVPPFSGIITEWIAFRDLFTALVINRKNISNVQRLHYLIATVKGEAAKLISHISLSDANFTAAWKILTEKYEDERSIINAHFQQLFAIPPIPFESLSALKRLRSNYSEAINALRALNQPVDEWNNILVYYLTQKLDKGTRRDWEKTLDDDNEYPTIKQLSKFIDKQIRSLESVETGSHSNKGGESVSKSAPKYAGNTVRMQHISTQVSCPLCSASHKLMHCEKFKAFSVQERNNYVRQSQICPNCLFKGHSVYNCKSKFTCFQCHKKHHTMLHKSKSSTNVAQSEATLQPLTNSNVAGNSNLPATIIESVPCTDVHTHVNSFNSRSVMLATAWVTLESEYGRKTDVRALIDQGSDASFISENLAQQLRLRREKIHARVTGIGGEQTTTITSLTNFKIKPIQSPDPILLVRALVLPRITSYTPVRVNLRDTQAYRAGLVLADPDPASLAPIELLIGADLYASIILDGVRKEPSNSLIAQNTIFGWILSGSFIPQTKSTRTVHVHHANFQEVNQQLEKFWEVEELPMHKCMSSEDAQCEKHFAENHTRSSCGRYIVRLPFKKDPPLDIGESRASAIASLYRMEKRFILSPELKTQYSLFMSDYINSGHMHERSESDSEVQEVFLPHHAVFKQDSSTTKLRVVFNASALTSNGSSLNDHLLAGPKLQSDLVSIILRWRNVRYVFTADIAQMYRQILVDPRDRNYQLILWRSSSQTDVRTYVLNTVTYGTTSAPFQAQRVINQLIEDEGHKFPLAVPILTHARYIDDIMDGDDDKNIAIKKRDQVTRCLASAGFSLRKWASNDPEILAGIDPANHGFALEKPFEDDSELKILGLHWRPKSDSFHIVTHIPQWTAPTKRKILSIIAHFFDPLGWLAPVVITPKILIQELWKLKVDWDASLPDHIIAKWKAYYEQLSHVNKITIPRWTGYSPSVVSIHLHGFCDASELAYAAVIFLVLESPNAEIMTRLVLAKTKVAPVKKLTIPRLELCAALLLSRCVSFLIESLRTPMNTVNCWSDSSVVLSWLRKSPDQLKVFVANRVAEIQTSMPNATWRHVPSEENSADCASRGLAPSKLESHSLWWNGPTWLKTGPESWPDQTFLETASTSLESKAAVEIHGLNARFSIDWTLPEDISSWPRLLRITAYIFRFIARCRFPDLVHREPVLQTAEITYAHRYWVRSVQREYFSEEIFALKNKRNLSANSPLIALDPYLDESGLVRVGGRLRNADLPMEQKHPIALPKHRISELIIGQIHRDTLHGGVQLMLRILRERYWVLGARSLVRNQNHKCVRCVRERAVTEKQFMASLPVARVTSSRPFSHCGVDYAGPLLVRNAAGRGRTSHKTYIALFICLSTRAIHLELVHDYSSSAFIAAFERFSARRGIPVALYSDNGTTFQGADRELSVAFKQITSDPGVMDFLSSDATAWNFLPPSAPHFGGLWEAGVKSVKHHMKRVLGASTPTVEEFTTLLCNIEACLNSRPLAPLNDDISSFDALTPGHFLIGAALKSVPMPSVLDLNEGRLNRWQLMRRKYEQFWRLWSQDYLHSLQQRAKWRSREKNLEVGNLVLLKNALLPPAKWELGRIIECFPDSENLVRTVKVQTARSKFVRPITKICKLPIESSKPELDQVSIRLARAEPITVVDKGSSVY